MAHLYMPSQTGLVCVPAQSQEHGGDTRRQAVTRGELDRAIEGQGRTRGALPEPQKMTSSRLLSC